MLGLAGLRGPGERLVTRAEEAARAPAEIGFPVVMKIDSPDIAHRTEAGSLVVPRIAGTGGEA